MKRYKRNQYSVYDDNYDLRLQGSRILSPGNIGIGYNMFIWTKQNIEYELIKLIGADEKGFYRDSFNDSVMAIIPSLEQRLTDIEVQFTAINLDREMRGQIPYEEMPSHLLKEKLLIESTIDLHKSEVQLLENYLKEGHREVERVRESEVLKYGLRQAIQLKNNKIDTIDGQKVVYLSDNLPVIAEGIYRGMAVLEYRKLSDKWLNDRRLADQAKLKRLQEQCKQNNQPIPKSLKGRGVKSVDINSLPIFPDWAKNHFEEEINKEKNERKALSRSY